MCLGAAPKETPLVMSDELAAVLLCKQQAKQIIGLAAGAHGKVLVTYTHEGVVAHSTTKEVSCQQQCLAAAVKLCVHLERHLSA